MLGLNNLRPAAFRAWSAVQSNTIHGPDNGLWEGETEGEEKETEGEAAGRGSWARDSVPAGACPWCQPARQRARLGDSRRPIRVPECRAAPVWTRRQSESLRVPAWPVPSPHVTVGPGALSGPGA